MPTAIIEAKHGGNLLSLLLLPLLPFLLLAILPLLRPKREEEEEAKRQAKGEGDTEEEVGVSGNIRRKLSRHTTRVCVVTVRLLLGIMM